MDLDFIIDALVDDLRPLYFGPPITHVYNPLDYAREAHDRYLRRYATPPKEVVFLGMNPGPWGMAQTGVPFGEVNLVKDWLRIETEVGTPADMHPKRPVQGFACPRSEVSGKRLWGWARKTFGTPEKFFARFFVANYCPLLFIESSGRNRTPDNLRASERKPLLEACDRAIKRLIERLEPRYVVGVGNFAAQQARAALEDLNVTIGKIPHPSPANPQANRGWDALVNKELSALSIAV
jgi:single-strand selective monofunctional uracil DNA glycosylase